MQAMGDLKAVADVIMQKLADGSLPTTNDSSTTSPPPTRLKSSRPVQSNTLQPERWTPRQAERKQAIMREIVQRYRFERKLPVIEDAEKRRMELIATVNSFDEHLTHAGVPTERLRDVYLEATRLHSERLLKVHDFTAAWERIRPREGAGTDLRLMSERGADCAICGGSGMTTRFVPRDARNPLAGGDEYEVECPYHCKVVMSVSVRDLASVEINHV